EPRRRLAPVADLSVRRKCLWARRGWVVRTHHTGRRMGIWSDIKPKAKRKHQWVFSQYLETSSERADGQWYVAFLFRDTDRALFGIREFVGRLPHDKDLRHMATRVIVDDAYRESMLSDRPELSKL